MSVQPKIDTGGSKKLEAEQIRLLMKSPWAMPATIIFSIVCVWVLWSVMDKATLIGWALANLVWMALRYLARRWCQRHVANDGKTIWRGRILVAMLGVTGLFVAFITTCIFLPTNAEDQMFLVMGIAGLAAGGAAIYGVYMPAVVVFISPILLTTAVTVYARGTITSFLMGCAVLFYLAIVLMSARVLNRWVTDTFRLRVRNDGLAEDLIAAKDAAEAANEAKTVFMANMSHELRTPLNAIIGFAEMLEKEVLGPLGNRRYVSYAHDIHMSGKHLLSIINTILDLAKTQASHLELDLEDTDINALLRECFSVMRLQADQARLTFTLSLPPEPLFARADETRLRQVIYNLLSNAIKFTDAGGAISLAGQAGATGGVEIIVSDSGLGMDADDLAIAFQPFMQVKQSDRRAPTGTGLGLPFAKSIVDLHGGMLEIKSALGKGTTVRVDLPAIPRQELSPATMNNSPAISGAIERTE